jgi:hypothetical protein
MILRMSANRGRPEVSGARSSDAIDPTRHFATINYIRNAIAVICGLGVLVFAYLAADGLDMSVGFF